MNNSNTVTPVDSDQEQSQYQDTTARFDLAPVPPIESSRKPSVTASLVIVLVSAMYFCYNNNYTHGYNVILNS